MSHVLITGAAGFIGSHLTDRFLDLGYTVTGIDNFERGTRGNLVSALSNARFHFIESDVSTSEGAVSAFETARQWGPVNTVWHLAANSDIPAGSVDSSIDLRNTFLTTFHVLNAMQRFGVPEVVFASSSAIYGVHDRPMGEDAGPLFPISYYGAMKLGSEGLISASVESFLSRAHILRFPNVIGGRATHGVILDLIGKLRRSAVELEVLGDGMQCKPYLHISDLLDAMMFVIERGRDRLNYFNISGSDEGCTVRSIAESVVRLVSPGTPIRYRGAKAGWVGDVPRFSYSIGKLSALGWQPKRTSTEAVEQAIREIHEQLGACSS